jgi:LacI family transcriptional regulator, repressor for deo operon, udp, cdd, tsx, nupC, and nupG
VSEPPIATMADVAARAGVSVATVSRALRGSELVAAATTARVRAAADALGFAVSRNASGLATGRLGRIAVLVSGPLGSWFNGSILDAIYGALREADHELLIFRVLDRAEREDFFTTLPARRNADAIIVASFVLSASERSRLRALSMPVVYLNQRARGAASVSIDDAAAVRAGMRYLTNLGHRRIGFARPENRTGFSYSSIQRVDGFRSEQAAAGIAVADQLVLTAADLRDGDGLLGRLLAAEVMPTALMVDSDELALSLLEAMSRVGLRAPEDLSVLGFDDHAMAGTFGLSTIAQPVQTLGVQAAAMASALATGRPVARRTVVVPTRLLPRRTTGRVEPDPSTGPPSASTHGARPR